MSSNDLFRYSPDAADPANESDVDEDSDEISEDDLHNRKTTSNNQSKGYTEIKEQMYLVNIPLKVNNLFWLEVLFPIINTWKSLRIIWKLNIPKIKTINL